jgi:ferredoxin
LWFPCPQLHVSMAPTDTKSADWIELTDMVVIDKKICLGCGQCVLVCEFEAIDSRYGLATIKRDQCVFCGVCVDFCPVDAITRKLPRPRWGRVQGK